MQSLLSGIMAHWNVTRAKLQQHHVCRMWATNPQRCLREEAAIGKENEIKDYPASQRQPSPLSSDLIGAKSWDCLVCSTSMSNPHNTLWQYHLFLAEETEFL